MRMRGFYSVICALALFEPLRAAEGASCRFFFCGDGRIAFDHAHFDERIEATYRDPAGRYDSTALERIAKFFRSREDGKVGYVALRLIELIDYVEDRYRPRRMVLISGYRSPEFNEQLRASGARAAKSSLHSEGIAADIAFEGVDLRKLWIALREEKIGGIGLYAADGFLHIDNGRPRFWEPRTSRVDENLSAGNARLFARTDFDRYDSLDGALITLHGVSALPVRIARLASLGNSPIALEPATGAWRLDGDCYVIDEPADLYRFRVSNYAPLPPRRATIELRICAPRVEATPKTVQTNLIEHE